MRRVTIRVRRKSPARLHRLSTPGYRLSNLSRLPSQTMPSRCPGREGLMHDPGGKPLDFLRW